MALTVKNLGNPRNVGYGFIALSEVTFDNSYQENGEPVTAAQLNLQTVDFCNCDIVAGSESSVLRPTNAYYKEGKLHLIDSATGKEVESAKDMSKVKVQVAAFGEARVK